MARKVLVLKRHPDLLTILSTRRGVAELGLITLAGGVAIKLVSMTLFNKYDALGLSWISSYVLNLAAQIFITLAFILAIMYYLTIKSWLRETFRCQKNLQISDRFRSFKLQLIVQKILNNIQIGNPNLSSKTIIVPDVYVRAEFKNNIMTNGYLKIEILPTAMDDIVALSNDISAALVNDWNYTIIADDFEINDEQTMVTYYLFDTQAKNRLVINHEYDIPVVNEHCLELMPGWVWDLNKEPHCNIAAETGYGKTYLANYMIFAAVKSKMQVFYADPKNNSNLDEGLPKNRVFYSKEDILKSLDNLVILMNERNYIVKMQATSRISQDFTDLGMPAIIYVFDELSAFLNSLDNKEQKHAISQLSQLLMKGRSAGVIVVAIGQQLDAKTFPTKLRNQAQLNIMLGPSTLETRTMLFGQGVDAPLTTFKPGSGLFTLSGLNIQPRRFVAPDMTKFEPVFLSNLKNISDETQQDWMLTGTVSRGNA